MKTTRLLAILLAALFVVSISDRVLGDTFGGGANTFNIDFVTIGNPNNTADTTGNPNPAGSIANVYRIGTYEISEQMIDKANTLGGLLITKATRGADKPATSVSWNEAARFVNWLDTSTGSPPAYKFALQPGDSGYSANADIQVWTPSDAGYNPTNNVYYDYPTGSNSAPAPVASGTAAGTAVWAQSLSQGPADITQAGGLSPYGTMGQGGNVYEWQETDTDLVNGPTPSSSPRGVRGGYWNFTISGLLSSSNRNTNDPNNENNFFGFRVASTPEPSSICLAAIASLGLLLRRRR